MPLPSHIRYDRRLVHLLIEIIDKHPAAGNFHPCPCGVTCVVVEPRQVRPEFHFVVNDVELRDRVRVWIKARGLPLAAYDGDDGVLVLAEMA